MIVPQITVAEALQDPSRLAKLGLVGDVLLSSTAQSDVHSLAPLFRTTSCLVEVSSDCDLTTATDLLDSGAAKIILRLPSGDPSSLTCATPLVGQLPAERLLVALPVGGGHLELMRALERSVSGFVLFADNTLPDMPDSILQDISKGFKDGPRRQILVQLPGMIASSPLIHDFDKASIDLVVPATQLSFGMDNPGKQDIGEAFAAPLVSDRADGLIPTIVVDEQGIALGLCYSSVNSISEAVRTGQGVYQSRTRGLWYKGASSGATQKLLKMSYDCDKDTLCFKVNQTDPGFCHLDTRTCFGNDTGISGLAALLRRRKMSAPEGSYTQRLFQDRNLLHSKIMEEAEELCEASSAEDIAWEAADLIYFALTKCTAAGVSLADIEKQLDLRSQKISRRPGDAKPKWNIAAKERPSTGQSGLRVDGNPSANAISQGINPSTVKAEIKMKTYIYSETKEQEMEALLIRPIIKTDEITSRVQPIMKDVRNRGDEALIELTAKFDQVKLSSPVIKAPFSDSIMKIPENVRLAIDQAYDNISKFHEAQLDKSVLRVETMPGVVCTRFFRPIERVGLYVPGGTAILPSSTLMLGVPAKVAGCKEIVIATPPRKDGTVAPEVIYVANKVGASTVVVAGGAQAVAAMAYGTESVPKVDKICGPGNQYVTAAKMIAQSDSSAMISIDMPAGPSELLVIADSSCNPAYVASDLLSQAEHGADSQVVLLAVDLSDTDVAEIEREVKMQGEALPRADIVRQSIPKSFILRVNTMEEAMSFSNDYAPEHLILHLENAEIWVEKVENAGSVFVGPYSPESCGDYASGTNHTLPTYGYARMYSGVNTLTFVKHITSQMLTREGLNALGDTVTTLAEIEGLEAHRNAVAIRLKDIRANSY